MAAAASTQLQPGSYGFPVKFKKRYSNYIGGEWVAPLSGEHFDNVSPVTGEVFCEVPRSNAADIDRALTQKNVNPGGELVLGSVQVPGIHAGTWHRLKIVFQGSTITGVMDGKQVLTAEDSLYPRGMAGLMAGSDEKTLSTPFYDNLLIQKIQKEDAPLPPPSSAQKGQTPIYHPVSEAARP